MAINNMESYLANANIAVVISMQSLSFGCFFRLSHFERGVLSHGLPIIWVT